MALETGFLRSYVGNNEQDLRKRSVAPPGKAVKEPPFRAALRK